MVKIDTLRIVRVRRKKCCKRIVYQYAIIRTFLDNDEVFKFDLAESVLSALSKYVKLIGWQNLVKIQKQSTYSDDWP